MTRQVVNKVSKITELSQAVWFFSEKTLTELPKHAAGVVLFVCAMAVTASIPNVSAQIATGRIVGRVTDASGAVIAGATVSITSDATSIVQTVRSSSGGDYVFEAVNPGTYTMKVTAPGFGELTRSGIQAHIQDYLTG